MVSFGRSFTLDYDLSVNNDAESDLMATMVLLGSAVVS